MSAARPDSPAGARPVALVTGAARRLGRCLALRAARLGYDVWIHYRSSRAEAEAAAREAEALGAAAHLVQGDLGRREEVDAIAAAVAAGGRLDLLVNNVGEYRPGPLLGYPPEDFERCIRVNLLGTQALIDRALPLFPPAGGSIVNVGYSGLGALGSHPLNTAYTISKAGVLILTRTYAEVLGPRRIRVNMISPGQLDNSVDLPADFAARVPLGRPGRVEDVADALEFLVGDRASYVTGQNLEVAGGYMLRLVDHLGEPGGDL